MEGGVKGGRGRFEPMGLIALGIWICALYESCGGSREKDETIIIR